MSIVTYSQFWPKLWRWERISGVRKTAGTMTLGLIWGSLLALAVVIMAVFVNGNGSRSDGNGWAWIDVVSGRNLQSILREITVAGLCNAIRQDSGHHFQIYPASNQQLQAQVNNRLEYHTAYVLRKLSFRVYFC